MPRRTDTDGVRTPRLIQQRRMRCPDLRPALIGPAIASRRPVHLAWGWRGPSPRDPGSSLRPGPGRVFKDSPPAPQAGLIVQLVSWRCISPPQRAAPWRSDISINNHIYHIKPFSSAVGRLLSPAQSGILNAMAWAVRWAVLRGPGGASSPAFGPRRHGLITEMMSHADGGLARIFHPDS